MGRGLTLAVAVVIAVFGTAAVGASRGASRRQLKGSYAGIFSGEISTGSGLLPIDGSGIFISDGKGNLSGHETITINSITCDANISGTYTVDADGSGTDSVAFTSSSPDCSGSYTQSFAIAEGGKLVLLANTNGDQITEKWYRSR